jgi:hypothetical protein
MRSDGELAALIGLIAVETAEVVQAPLGDVAMDGFMRRGRRARRGDTRHGEGIESAPKSMNVSPLEYLALSVKGLPGAMADAEHAYTVPEHASHLGYTVGAFLIVNRHLDNFEMQLGSAEDEFVIAP